MTIAFAPEFHRDGWPTICTGMSAHFFTHKRLLIGYRGGGGCTRVIQMDSWSTLIRRCPRRQLVAQTGSSGGKAV